MVVARIVACSLPLALAAGCVVMDSSGTMEGPRVTAMPGGNESARVQGMTDAHNGVRRRTAAAPPLPDLQWSDELAQVAQSYAEKLAREGCDLVHSTNNPFGENLASFGGQRADPTRVVELWASEEQCYTFGTFDQGDSCSCEACGHYTQLVWRDTELVGCGVADCGADGEVWVCNYDPPGNFIGQRPY